MWIYKIYTVSSDFTAYSAWLGVFGDYYEKQVVMCYHERALYMHPWMEDDSVRNEHQTFNGDTLMTTVEMS